MLENTLGSPLDSKEIKPFSPKGSQSWIFIGRTDAVAEATILWTPDAITGLIGKDPDAGKDWRQEEKEMTEDEMVGWHHWPIEHEYEQAPLDGEGQESLTCCSPWGCKKSDMTEWLRNNKTGTPSSSDQITVCALSWAKRLHLVLRSLLVLYNLAHLGLSLPRISNFLSHLWVFTRAAH